jgi:hypothetical protein
MKHDLYDQHFTPATALQAEGARIGFCTCLVCGAAILLDPRDGVNYARLHTEWHIARMNMPVRIQLSRLKGWRMPPNTVKVTRPGKWGNPYRTDNAMNSVEAFQQWIDLSVEGARLAHEAETELRGKNLACWCALDRPCHADVLLRIANRERAEDRRDG